MWFTTGFVVPLTAQLTSTSFIKTDPFYEPTFCLELNKDPLSKKSYKFGLPDLVENLPKHP